MGTLIDREDPDDMQHSGKMYLGERNISNFLENFIGVKSVKQES